MIVTFYRIPFTYCWSPSLIPKPSDWPSHIGVCGFFFRDPPSYEPPPEIKSFIEHGPPPIYIGFGSIVIDDPAKLTTILLRAVREAGVRAIISRGWSNLGDAAGLCGNDVLYIGDCPHEWLFQHVAAVVHHGGAGTTACGLLNGRPTTVIPFFGDQPFWGAMVANAGAGPQPIPLDILTYENLAAAIRFCLTQEALSAAETLSCKMRSESGIRNAVDQFHASLTVGELECDIIKDRAAAWIYRKGKTHLKLSKLAAEILIENMRIHPSQLERYIPRPIVIDPVRWDPVTATTSSLASTLKGMVVSTSDIFIKPVQAYQRPAGNLGHMRHLSESELSTYSSFDKHRSWPMGDTNSIARTRLREFSTGNLGVAIIGSASGVSGFLKCFFKGMYVDMPLATTEGLRSLPKLYGGEVREINKITDWKSGAAVAGKNFVDGFKDGFTDLVQEPIKGGREDGTLGAIKGIGKGSANMLAKASSGVLGLVAYPGHGICKSINAAVHHKTARSINHARLIEGQYLVKGEQTTCRDFDEVLVRDMFDRLQ